MKNTLKESLKISYEKKKRMNSSKKKETLSEILEKRKSSLNKEIKNNDLSISRNIFPDVSFDDTDEDTPQNTLRTERKNSFIDYEKEITQTENNETKNIKKKSAVKILGKLLFNFSPKNKIEELKEKIYESERKEYNNYKKKLNLESKRIDFGKVENKKIKDLKLLYERKKNKFNTIQNRNNNNDIYNYSLISPEKRKITLEIKRKYIEKRREKEKEEKERKFKENYIKKIEERKEYKLKNKNNIQIENIEKIKKSKKLLKGVKNLIIDQIENAEESIRTGIYITLCSNINGNRNECYKIGLKNKCICGHKFDDHENQIYPSLITKCHSCICNKFTYIPIYPEETNKYFLTYYNHFNYDFWTCQCKCNHGFNSHNVNNHYMCDLCNCNFFSSNFKCAVCNKFLEEHKLIYEKEIERKILGYSYANDYYPFNQKMIEELLI